MASGPPAETPAVVGLGQTRFTRWGGLGGVSEFELACMAIRDAARDAGLDVREIDGLASFADSTLDPALLQVALGLPTLGFTSLVWGGRGGGACGAVAHAAAAVAQGLARHVAVVRSVCQGQTRRYGRFFGGRQHVNMTLPFGLHSPAQMMALVLQRYFHETGCDPAVMGEIAVSCRDNAGRNPAAVMFGRPLTLADHAAGRPIAEPLRLFDCCLESDGACAVIVTTLERARDLAATPVRILAAAQGSGPRWGAGPMGSHNVPLEDYATANGAAVARALFGRAGVAPQDVDVVQIYDHFSGMVLLSLEDYGFCRRGEAGDFVAAGGIRWPDGALPLNTAGGNLSEAYVHGMNLVLEAARQIRGTSTSQVADAELSFVCSGGGVAPTSAALFAA